jgi:hypothetical protein
MPLDDNIPEPNNPEEGSYIAVAMLNELLSVLIEKRTITRDDIGRMLDIVQGRLAYASNGVSNRAARSLAKWKSSEE